MVNFTLKTQQHNNLTPQKTIFQTYLLHFHPIIITTLTTLFNTLPLILSNNNNSKLQQPLKITIINKLIINQLLTLYTTPIIYLFFNHLQLHFSHKPKQTITK